MSIDSEKLCHLHSQFVFHLAWPHKVHEIILSSIQNMFEIYFRVLAEIDLVLVTCMLVWLSIWGGQQRVKSKRHTNKSRLCT